MPTPHKEKWKIPTEKNFFFSVGIALHRIMLILCSAVYFVPYSRK